jgi:hypothetical protein
MFRYFAALLACLGLLAAAPTGALYVTTLPSGADVWIDGTYTGHSPLVLDALTAGRHTVSLTKTGWVAQNLDVSIVAGSTALSSVELQRSPGRLHTEAGTIAIRGMTVKSLQVDGLPLVPDKLGLYAVRAGLHEVVAMTTAGKVTRTITVYPEMRTDIVLRNDDPQAPAVVAPAADYLPAAAIRIEADRVAIKFGGHEVEGHLGSTTYKVDGKSLDFDSAPTLIGSKLYLPLALLTRIAPPDKAQ